MQTTSTLALAQNTKISYSVPTLVKWAGGKKQLLPQFEKFLPEKIERYLEPFVGGGAVAFHILYPFCLRVYILSRLYQSRPFGRARFHF